MTRPSKPSKRDVAIALNSLRHFVPEGKEMPAALQVRAKRTFDPSAGSEHKEQQKVIAWWDGSVKRVGAHKVYDVPHFALYAIPNAGRRSMAEAAWLKSEGLRAGIPDLCLAVPRDRFHGLYLELKYGKGKETPAQIDALAYLRVANYWTATCWTAEEAIRVITDYLEGRV